MASELEHGYDRRSDLSHPGDCRDAGFSLPRDSSGFSHRSWILLFLDSLVFADLLVGCIEHCEFLFTELIPRRCYSGEIPICQQNFLLVHRREQL